MNWKDINKKAVLLIANDKVKREMVSKNFGEIFMVGDEDKNYDVRLVSGDGSSQLLCNCKNGSLHAGGLCCHKLAVIMFCQRELWK